MKLIQEAAKLTDLIIGKRTYDEKTIYRPLKYLIYRQFPF